MQGQIAEIFSSELRFCDGNRHILRVIVEMKTGKPPRKTRQKNGGCVLDPATLEHKEQDKRREAKWFFSEIKPRKYAC